MKIELARKQLEVVIRFCKKIDGNPQDRHLLMEWCRKMGNPDSILATLEAGTLQRNISKLDPELKGVEQRSFTPSSEQHALLLPMVLAAVIRCVASNRCPHAVKGGVPLFAFVAAEVISCRRCMPSFFAVIAAHDAEVEAGTDSFCDFCLNSDEIFWPYSVCLQESIVRGDICRSCHELTVPK